jgi:hypothetical protein
MKYVFYFILILYINTTGCPLLKFLDEVGKVIGGFGN